MRRTCLRRTWATGGGGLKIDADRSGSPPSHLQDVCSGSVCYRAHQLCGSGSSNVQDVHNKLCMIAPSRLLCAEMRVVTTPEPIESPPRNAISHRGAH